jgi:hypothetical protein
MAVKFATNKEAQKYLRSVAGNGGNLSIVRETMGPGTDSCRVWETIMLDGKPIMEIRWGTHDAGVYRL